MRLTAGQRASGTDLAINLLIVNYIAKRCELPDRCRLTALELIGFCARLRREINQRRYIVKFYKHSSDPIGDHVLERERNHDGLFRRQEAETSIFIIPDPTPFCEIPICNYMCGLRYSGLLLTLRIHIIYIYSAHRQHLLTLLMFS